MEKKRIYYLDIAKGIGVVLMILGHIPELTVPSRQFVTSFHMPLFFVISGMILCATKEEKREKREIFKRKLLSIMVPYAVFSILSLCVEIFGTSVLKNSTWETFREHLFATFCLSGASVFWFLPALFFGELIFLTVRKKTSGTVCGILIAVLAYLAYLGMLAANPLQAEHPYMRLFVNAVLRTFFAAAFIGLGYAGYGLIQKVSHKPIYNMLLGVLLMALTFFISQKNGITDMNYMVYNNIFFYLITSVSGSFGVIFISRVLEKWHRALLLRICMYYGRNSLIVMMTHAPFYIMYIAARVAYAINNYMFELGQILLCSVIICVVLVIEVGVIEILNRYFPFLLGRFRKKSA